jgi:signal transduction histidine kinase
MGGLSLEPCLAGMLRRNAIRAVSLLQLAAACLSACLTPWPLLAAEPLPRSILVLEQSDVRGPFYGAVYSGLQSEVNATSTSPVTIYIESVELSRFPGPEYEQSLRAHLEVKYRNIPVGVVVTVGPLALNYALQRRAELWPGAPIVFAFADETTIAGLNLPNDVTGRITRLRLQDMVAVARVVVKGLKRVAIIGDRFENHPVFRHFADELPAVAAELEVIDLTGLPMAELRKRVAALPDDAAILYTSLFSEGALVYRRPVDALAMIAEVANRPIVIAIETHLTRGGIGGNFTIPSIIGKEAATLALRILDGESPAGIPIRTGDTLQPIFDWRQMQRWAVSERDLPAGSEIRNRDLTIWQVYPLEITAIAAIVFLQSILIVSLLYERRRRRRAELEGRQRMAELAHMSRQATAGQLSASIAHELNQPLGAILNNVEAAALMIKSPSLDVKEIETILDDIRRDDHRASEVIKRLRRFLTRGAFDPQELDFNEVVRDVLQIVSAQAAARDVKLESKLAPQRLRVNGDRVQLQQVILNLIVNGIDAIAEMPNGVREITCRSWASDGQALVSIRDTGSGIPSERLERLFEPFFTTKQDGMGMGLSIAHAIVEAHGGKISAEGRSSGGVFHVSLPLAKT